MELALWAFGGWGWWPPRPPGCGAASAHWRGQRARSGAELEAVRQLAEDAVLLGEELVLLDARTADVELTEEARADYWASGGLSRPYDNPLTWGPFS